MKWLVVLAIICTSARAQQPVSAKIVDGETLQPVPFASVGVVGTALGTSSNATGDFTLQLAPERKVKITCIGYQSLELDSLTEGQLIKLQPTTTQLAELIIFNKSVNPQKIVRRAFASVEKNYPDKPFFQRFFYRHYCKDGSRYGRLIEAFADTWKAEGYHRLVKQRKRGEAIRITHLRRSLDQTAAARGHEPIAVSSVLQADIAAYQLLEGTPHISVFESLSNLKYNLERYQFTLEGITVYDNSDAYIIAYQSKPDSILTTSGYVQAPKAKGTLFVATDTHAIIKAEETKLDRFDSLHSTVYYRLHEGRYYPYHLIREGTNAAPGAPPHWYHVEMVSVDIQHEQQYQFSSEPPTRESLLKLEYDSLFWRNASLLKATPLEEEIIADLGGGRSLSQQFKRYQTYETNLAITGDNGDDRFRWLQNEVRSQQPMFLAFWSSASSQYLYELEFVKQLHVRFKEEIVFVMLCLDDNDETWKTNMNKFNLFAHGMLNFRIGSNALTAKQYQVNELPRYVILDRNGQVMNAHASRPFDPKLEDELRAAVDTEQE